MPLYFDWTCVIEFRDACFRGRASLKRWMLSGNFDARGRDARGLRNQYLRILAHNSLSALAKTQYVDLDQAVSRGGSCSLSRASRAAALRHCLQSAKFHELAQTPKAGNTARSGPALADACP